MRHAAVLVVLAACGADDLAQHEITAPGELLTEDGTLREPGWASRELLRWDPARVHDPAQLRQWDFFTIANAEAAVNLTLVDLGFLQVATVGVVDLATGESFQALHLAGGLDTLTLTGALEGDAALTADGAPVLAYTTDADSTAITIAIASSADGVAADGAFTVTRRPEMPYLSLATPFPDDPHLFFYEHKLHGMAASGALTIGGRTFMFDAADTWAVMDWGRGAWPATALWRWGGGSGDGFAFNLGNGFGDDRAGTENLLVVGDVAHKLGRVTWTYDPGDPMAAWRFDAPDGSVSLVLHPDAPEIGGLDFGSVFSRVTKAYGTFTGTIVLGDGETLAVDGAHGFAEQMELSW